VGFSKRMSSTQLTLTSTVQTQEASGLKMRPLLVYFSACVACFASAPALARSQLHVVAECLVRADAPRVQAWVDYDGPGLIYKEISEVVSATHCSSTTPPRFEYWTFRGALAEALVKKMLSGSMIPDLSDITPPTDVLMAQRWGNNDGRVSMLLDVFAECEAKADPSAVFAVLSSTPNAGEEKRQIKGIVNKNDACRAASVDVARTQPTNMIRARFGFALYRLLRLAAVAKAKAAN